MIIKEGRNKFFRRERKRSFVLNQYGILSKTMEPPLNP
jgi:hypothetical protein